MKKYLKIGTIMILIIMIATMMFFFKSEIISKSIVSTNKTNNHAVQRLMMNNNLSEEVLNLNNCDYEFNDNGNLILREYFGDADSVIIPEKIDEYKVEDIDPKIFINATELEIIKIPLSFEKKINEILNFKKSEEVYQNKYIIFSTTKEYNEKYLKYITLTDEEKSKQELIPDKFIVLPQKDNEIISELKIKTQAMASEPQANYSASFDLRKKINIRVETQSPLKICYAYATNKSIETNLALRNKITNENLSEVHLAVMSKQGAAGWFQTARNRYLNYGYGPVDESVWSKSRIESKKNETDKIAYNYCISRQSVTEQQIEKAFQDMKKTSAKYSVMKTKDFPAINGTKKKDNNYKNTVKEQRNEVKQFIMNYGSLWVVISDPNNSSVCGNNGRQIVLNASSPEVSNVSSHTASIIGWDDNFDKNNFNCLPAKNRPSTNGAYLALNSWGSAWGNNGTFWISYEDFDVDAYMHGVMTVKKGKVKVSDADIILKTNTYNYNGKEKRPQVEFKYENDKYNIQRDYTVEYINNVNPGIASVKITGTGRFTGTVTKTFNINPPTPTITRSDYNTFKYNATGAKSYYISNSQSKPIVKQEEIALNKFELNKWTSVTSTEDLNLEEGKTYYVWAKSDTKGGTISANYATITVRKMIRKQGEGTELTTGRDGISNTNKGTEVKDDVTLVLEGTPFWCVAKAKEGYSNLELKEENTTRDANGYKIIINKDKTISSSAIVSKFNIIYNANGGNDKTVPEKQTKIRDEELQISSKIPTRGNKEIEGYTVTLDPTGGIIKETEDKKIIATRTKKYKFKNWNTQENGKGVSYKAGEKYTDNKELKLYAQWEEKEETKKITLPKPIRTGYTFNGWYTLKTGGKKIDENAYKVTENIKLYAQWTASTYYTVEYNANGGNDKTVPKKQTKIIDGKLQISSTIPTRENKEIEGYTVTLDPTGGIIKETEDKKIIATRIKKYKFKNWNTQENGKGVSYKAGEKYTDNKELKLYAQWEEEEETKKITLPKPIRTGYTFNGWYTLKTSGEKIDENDYKVTKNITLYAQWMKIEEEKNDLNDEKKEDDKIEDDKIEDDKIEDDKIEDDKIEDDKIEDDKKEDDKIEDDKKEDNKIEDDRKEDDKKEDDKKEDDKIEDDKIEDDKIEDDKIEDDKIEDDKRADNKNQDNTIANKEMPDTGKQLIIRAAFLGILIISIILYVKYNRINKYI